MPTYQSFRDLTLCEVSQPGPLRNDQLGPSAGTICRSDQDPIPRPLSSLANLNLGSAGVTPREEKARGFVFGSKCQRSSFWTTGVTPGGERQVIFSRSKRPKESAVHRWAKLRAGARTVCTTTPCRTRRRRARNSGIPPPRGASEGVPSVLGLPLGVPG